MTPDSNVELKLQLYNLHQPPLPFQPVILVFSTGAISDTECVPMIRDPEPKLGTKFSEEIMLDLKAAMNLNPSIHDGAIVFSRSSENDDYFLSAWSMRIVSRHISEHAEPNVGSAHNSALALSLSTEVDLCAILTNSSLVLFENGVLTRVEGKPINR